MRHFSHSRECAARYERTSCDIASDTRPVRLRIRRRALPSSAASRAAARRRISNARASRSTFTPARIAARMMIDAFGNLVTRLEFEQPHRQLDVLPQHGSRGARAARRGRRSRSHPWERVRDDLDYRSRAPPRDVLEACRFRHESPSRAREAGVHGLRRRIASLPRPPVLGCAEALMEKLHAS